MKTKIPAQDFEAATGWVFYDSDCSLCANTARRFQNVLIRHGFNLASLQSPRKREHVRLRVCAAPDEMIVLLPDNRMFGGADGIVQIARRIWWAWPLFALSQIPGAMILLRAIYRRVAANRQCLSGVCSTRKPSRHATFFEMP